MYIVYDDIQDGGVAVLAVLEEAGIPYDLARIDKSKDEHKSPAYTAINPRQQVVAMGLPDGSIMTEGVAILILLAQRHPEAKILPPQQSPAWAQAVRWLLFMATNIYEGENRKINPQRYTVEASCSKSVEMAAIQYVNWHYRILDEQIVGPYFFGEQACAVDYYIWMLVQWHGDLDWLKAKYPKVLRLVELVMSRPKIAPLHLAQFGEGIGLCPKDALGA